MAKRQRIYSSKFKAKVVLEVLSGKRSPSEASRSHKIHSSVLCLWKNEFINQAHRAFEGKQGKRTTLFERKRSLAEEGMLRQLAL